MKSAEKRQKAPPEMEALRRNAGGFAWGRGPLRIMCVRERVGLDGVGFSPPNLTGHHHSDHSNSPESIIITLLLIIIFPIIPAAEEEKPRRGKR